MATSSCALRQKGAGGHRPPFFGSIGNEPSDKSLALPRSALFERVIRLAAETGARFTRDRIGQDPVDWLTTPKALFGGDAPLDACRTQHGFATAMLFHELSLGLDCMSSALAGLPRAQARVQGSSFRPPVRMHPGADREDEGPALYTFVISSELCPGHVQIFGAMIARSAIEVRERLRLRCGPTLEDEAIVRVGFDWSEPMACAMVSDAMADVLALASKDPTSSIAAGLDFQVEQRFAI